MLQELAGFYDKLASDNRDEGDLQVKAVMARAKVGEIQERLGQHEKALLTFRRALGSYRQLIDRKVLEDSVETRVGTARLRNQLGRLLKFTGDLNAGNLEHQLAVDLLMAGLEKFGNNQNELLFTLAESFYLLGRHTRPGMGPNSLPPALDENGEATAVEINAETRNHLEQALKILDQIRQSNQIGLTAEAHNSWIYLNALCNRELSIDTWSQRTNQDNVRHLNAIAYLEQLSQESPNNLVYKYQLTKTLAEINVFENGMTAEQLSEAQGSLLRAIEIGTELTKSQPDVMGFHNELVHAYFKLGVISKKLAQVKSGEERLKLLEEQEAHLRRALNIQGFLNQQQSSSFAGRIWLAKFALSIADCKTMEKKRRNRSRLVERAINILFALPDKVKSRREVAQLIKSAKSLSSKTLIGTDEAE